MSFARRCLVAFDRVTQIRGRIHAYSNAVTLVSCDEQGAVAQVDGTSAGQYRVDLDWSEVNEGVLQAFCSCPHFDAGHLCKHIWATLLTLDQELPTDQVPGPPQLTVERAPEEIYEEEDPDDEEDDFDEYLGQASPTLARFPRLLGEEAASKESRDGAPPRPDSAPPTRGESAWMKPLSELQRPSFAHDHPNPWDRLGRASRLAWYVLDVERSRETKELIISLFQQERKKDGEYGKVKRLVFSRQDVLTFSDPADRVLLLQLLDCSRNREDWERYRYQYRYRLDTTPPPMQVSDAQLAPSFYRLLLPQIAQTGRFVWMLSSSQPIEDARAITWDGTTPWHLGLVITADDARQRWTLSGQFVRGDEIMPLSDVVASDPSGLLLSRTKLALFETDIPQDWIAWVLRQTPPTVPYANREAFLRILWSAPGLPTVKWPENLALQPIREAPRPRLRVREQTSALRQTFLRADVSFLYGDMAVEPESLQMGFPEASVEDGPFTHVRVRDLPSECQHVETLNQLPTIARDRFNEQAGVLQFQSRVLPEIVDRLLQNGWHVEAEGKLFRSPGNFRIEVQSGIDWFDLEATIDFDGLPATLPQLLDAARRGDHFIELGDGSRGILPTEWLRRYTDVAELGEATDGKVRFARSQALLLDSLLAEQEHLRVDPSFAEYRQRLRNVDGIAPQKATRSFQGTLRNYQEDGLGWFHFLQELGVGGCLADDMGLGKTIQVLAMLEARRTRRLKKGETRAPSLVVVPKSLIFNWMDEAAHFTPRLRLLNFTGSERMQQLANFNETDLILTTYGTLRRDIVTLKDQQFDYVILDEAQAIKNANSQAAKACLLLPSTHRLALTGTPIENHLGELWSLFEFLNPGMLGRSSAFTSLCKSIRGNDADALGKLARAIAPFVLRRTKTQVLDDLPEKTEQTIFCELSPKERKAYDELRNYYRAKLAKVIDQRGLQQSKIHVLEALLRLRQAACHQGLIDAKKKQGSSAKLDTLLEQLDEAIGEGHKALVFSQFTSLLAIVRERLDKRAVPYAYLDGSTRDRRAVVDQFQNDEHCKVFLISLKAGGQGLNLTAAEYVFILDPWWNPAVEMQAIDRAHRIGQTQHVFAYRIIARDTVEEKVLALQESKRELASAIITANDSLIRKLTSEDLKLILS